MNMYWYALKRTTSNVSLIGNSEWHTDTAVALTSIRVSTPDHAVVKVLRHLSICTIEHFEYLTIGQFEGKPLLIDTVICVLIHCCEWLNLCKMQWNCDSLFRCNVNCAMNSCECNQNHNEECGKKASVETVTWQKRFYTYFTSGTQHTRRWHSWHMFAVRCVCVCVLAKSFYLCYTVCVSLFFTEPE